MKYVLRPGADRTDRIGPLYARFLGLVAIGLVGIGLAGCGGSGAARKDTADEPAPDTTQALSPGAGIRAIAVSESGLVYREGEAPPRALAPADSVIGARAVSPNGRYVSAAVSVGDSARLVLVDRRTRQVRTLDVRARPVVYSADWSPDGGRLAFGFYRREGDEWGPGGIRIADLGASTRSVGCQSARKILRWLPDGNLAARSADDLYVVRSEDCGTVSSVDARRMFLLTYSPEARRLALVYRELVYDRADAEYVPDSTLMLADPSGENREEVVGDAYRVRHLEWAPDGSELAFDARSRKDSTRRQIIVYDVQASRLTYLVPPGQRGPESELFPRWSPSGDRVAYTIDRESGRYAAVRDVGRTQMLGPVRRAVWGWVGEKMVVVPGPDAVRIVNVGGETVATLPASWTPLVVWSEAPS